METTTSRLPRFLLRGDRVIRGDVLLTRPIGKESKTMAKLSGGNFSHAALCLGTPFIFESDGGIIGTKVLHRLGWAKEGAEAVPLYAIPGNPEIAAEVYRHPNFDEVEERFEQAIFDEMADSRGKDYSDYYRLVRLADLPDSLKALATAATRLCESYFRADQIPGPFCSELVARTYEKMELALFAVGKRPDEVRPNDLANSMLKIVPGCVIDSDIQSAIIQTFCPENKPPNYERDSTVVDNAFHDQQWALRAFKSSEDQTLKPLLERQSAQLTLILANFTKELASVEFLINSSQETSPQHLARALRLSKEAIGLSSELVEIARQEQPDLEKHKKVMARLTQFDRSLLRSTTLFTSELLKQASPKCVGWVASLRRLSLRQKRQRILVQTRNILNNSTGHY